MAEESYEMSRSRSDASRSTDQHGEYNSEEEQVNLLNKEEQSDSEEEEGLGEDEEWAIIVDENEVDVVHDFEKVTEKKNPAIFFCFYILT